MRFAGKQAIFELYISVLKRKETDKLVVRNLHNGSIYIRKGTYDDGFVTVFLEPCSD